MSRRLPLVLLALASACSAPRPVHHVPADSSTWVEPVNESIVVAGRRFHVGAPVVLWTEPPHYDAYSTEPRFMAADAPGARVGPRYEPGRVRRVQRDNPEWVPPPRAGEPDERTAAQQQRRITESEEVLVEPFSTNLAAARRAVDQFVLHYDVCGLSQTCFRVLHDQRGLSVQFLLDLDGTIYQTLDARETAWHATKSNSRSVGVEIANMGAYPLGVAQALDEWYATDVGGSYVRIPARYQDGGLRQRGFVARPARSERVIGRVQGEELQQHDFTPEQYASLVKLTAALCRAFPAIEPDAPRGPDGKVLDRALTEAEWRDFRGILGHYHVQRDKVDPGPAFDWERFLAEVRARLAFAAPAP
ncbi:MAG: N-acetylmuramoyl-L-alanine amidase [Planctomycetes bacterium]|nr:N-acetylmuramoyl-L-alanine amidase [Planctomycetota bacterium]